MKTKFFGRLNVTTVTLLTCSMALSAFGTVVGAATPTTSAAAVSATGTPVAVNLTSSGNVSAIVQDGTKPKNGGLDTFGYALSANLLGVSRTWSGVTFVPGAAGAVDAASSATIPLPQGSFTALKLLALGANGNQINQKFLITYTDGTTTTITQNVSDWWSPQSYGGESTVLNMASCVSPAGGKCTGPAAVYGYSFTLNGSKTAKSLTLPNNRNVILLAAALLPAAAPVTAAVNLSGVANVHALFQDGTAPTHGGLVGSGYALSANLTGASVGWAGASFSMGAAGAASAVNSATVPLPAGNFTALKLLAVGAHGNQTNQPFIVTYTDGTKMTFQQSVSDWWSPAYNPGETTVLNMAYCVTPTGAKCPGATALYGSTLTLNGAKTVKSLTLPNNRNVVLLGAALVGTQAVTTAPAVLAFGAATYTVAQSGKAALVSVNRSGPASAAVSVQYETADGSGTAGSLYTAQSGTLNWAANDTATKTVSVPISNATPFLGEKSFTLALFNPSAGAELNTLSLATVNVAGTAVNTTVQMSAGTYTVAANAGSLTVSVTRSNGATSPASVAYATAAGTALAGINYSSSSGTLNWAANDSASKSFTVPITNVASMTGNASFKLQISAPNGATLGPNSSATVTIVASSGSGTTDSSNPAAPSNLVMTGQTSNSVSLAWGAATPGFNPVALYKIYRNGSAYGTSSGTTYSDNNATNATVGKFNGSATVYSYAVSAVDSQGNEGPRTTQIIYNVYSNGVFSWKGDYSYSASINYQDTTGAPESGPYDMAVNVNGAYGGIQPYSGNTVPQWDLEAGSFNYFSIDLKPTKNGQKWHLHLVSRLPPGDVIPWTAVDVSKYGPAPVAGKWATYKIPLSAVSIGKTSFEGSISGNTLTVTSVDSGVGIDAGGFVTGDGVKPGTYILGRSADGGQGKYTISPAQDVSATSMTEQRTSIFKFDLYDETGWSNNQYYVDNVRFTRE